MEKEKFFLSLVRQGRLSVSKTGVCVNLKTGNKIGTVNSSRYKMISWLNPYVNKIQTMLVHRLVWLVHKGKIPKTLVINHMDGDRKNNAISNLEVCTVSRNNVHALALGLLKPLKGGEKPNAKFTDDEVFRYRKLYTKGDIRISAICKKHRAHSLTVQDMLEGKTYRHIKGL